MRSEWDSKKNRINRAKHDGLDFETAARVFDDPNVVLMRDRVVEGEQRWHAIGAVFSAQRPARDRALARIAGSLPRRAALCAESG